MNSPAGMSDRRAALVLIVSGALGWWIGVSARGGQVPVETAQVLAGIVVYPSQTPFFIYHVKIWTLLIQLSAVALKSGVPEHILSTLLSGLTAQVACQAIALAMFVLSRSVWVSVWCLPAVLVSRAFDYGAVYPIAFYDTPHTYGSLGLSAAMLIVLLLAIGWWRSGALMLGLLPAIHPSLGLWTTIAFAATLVVAGRSEYRARLPALRWYFVGLLLTAVSLAVHLAGVPALPYVAEPDKARYLEYFVSVWDTHRQPVNPFGAGLILNVLAVVVSAAYLRLWPANLTPSARLVLTFAAVLGLMSVLIAIVSHVPSAQVPAALLIAMPSRMLNVNTILFCPIVIGLLASERSAKALGLIAFLCFAAVVVEFRSTGQVHVTDVRTGRLESFAVVVLVAFALMLFKARGWFASADADRSPRRGATRLAGILLGLACGHALLILTVQAVAYESLAADSMRDYSNDAVYAQISARPGLLLASPRNRLLQLRTRRPVLLDASGINGLPYALESAPLIERVLRDAYGMEFFDPPADVNGLGMVPYVSGQAIWEKFPLQRWQAIRREYGVTDVATPIDWSLQLPTVVAGSRVRLFTIPD